MALMHLPLTSITISNLQQLIDNKTSESRYIDYKRQTYGNNDKEKMDFYKDISSFANSNGGDLVIGMTERSGIPTEFLPFEGDIEVEKLRLAQMAQSGLEPQILNLQIHTITYESGYIIVIRIPRSYSLPHRVNFQSYNKYFTRVESGKEELGVTALRHLFNATTQFEAQIRKWRDERNTEIVNNTIHVNLAQDKPVLVLHLIPYSINDFNARLDLTKILNNEDFAPIGLQKAGGCYKASNFDGYYFYSNVSGKDKDQRAYTQIFHTGAVESVNTSFHLYNPTRICMEQIKQDIVNYTYRYMKNLSKYGIVPPMAILVSLLCAKGQEVCWDIQDHKDEDKKHNIIKKDKLVFMEVVLETIPLNSEECKKLLQPLLIQFANTAGM